MKRALTITRRGGWWGWSRTRSRRRATFRGARAPWEARWLSRSARCSATRPAPCRVSCLPTTRSTPCTIPPPRTRWRSTSTARTSWDSSAMSSMRIADVRAFPTSFPVPPEARVSLGIGTAVKRDAVVVKVTTDEGLVGWGESHHGRSPGAVAHHANTTLKQLVMGMDAADVVGVWARIYKMQLGSHGMGAATAIAMSGIDMALWDIRGKAVGWPLYRLLGGRRSIIK